MRQFLLPRQYTGQKSFRLGGRDFHYLTRVLRLRQGDSVAAIDDRGTRYSMRIGELGHGECTVALSPSEPPLESPLRTGTITLLQCLPKGRKIDHIVRQATEAGVSRIVPLFSEHSLVRSSDDGNRTDRLQSVAREALQQSGAAQVPIIDEPRPLADLGKSIQEWGTALFFHQEPLGNLPLHELLAEAAPVVSLLIGPEGGISQAEVDMLGGWGFHPVLLGGTVLRVETAAIYAIGAVQTILQEKKAWILSHRR